MVIAPQVSIVAVVIGQAVDKLLFIPALLTMVAFLDPTTFGFSMLAMAVGSACTCAGAFVAARRADRAFVLHGVVVALITVCISFARYLNAQTYGDPSAHPLWWEILAWSMSLIAGILGGWVAGSLRAASATGRGEEDERD